MENINFIYGLSNMDIAIKKLVKHILIIMGINLKYMPKIKLWYFDEDIHIASYTATIHTIKVDITKIDSVDELINIMLHECEHLWQWINYTDTMMFFNKHRKLYTDTYGTVFNIMEFDAHTVSWTGGKRNMRALFEKIDINYLNKHINDWKYCLPSIEAFCQNVYKEKENLHIQEELILSLKHQDLIDEFERFGHLLEFWSTKYQSPLK